MGSSFFILRRKGIFGMCCSGVVGEQVVKWPGCDVLLASCAASLHISGPIPRLVTEATGRMGSVLSLQPCFLH